MQVVYRSVGKVEHAGIRTMDERGLRSRLKQLQFLLQEMLRPVIRLIIHMHIRPLHIR